MLITISDSKWFNTVFEAWKPNKHLDGHRGKTIQKEKKRVYGQFCIETLHERHNGIERLVACLSEYLPLIWKK